jgi:hypothetical protein
MKEKTYYIDKWASGDLAKTSGVLSNVLGNMQKIVSNTVKAPLVKPQTKPNTVMGNNKRKPKRVGEPATL